MQTFLVLSDHLLLMPFLLYCLQKKKKKIVYLQIDIFGNSERSLTMPQVQCWAPGNWHEKSLKRLLTPRSSSCSPVLTWPSGPRSSAAAAALQSEKALPKQAALSSQADSSPIPSAPRWRHSFLTSLLLASWISLEDLPLSAHWCRSEAVGACSQEVHTVAQLSSVTGRLSKPCAAVRALGSSTWDASTRHFKGHRAPSFPKWISTEII